MSNITANTIKRGLEHITVTDKEKEMKEKFVDDSQEARIQKQKKDFFALLSAQLQNQDPTQPMDTNQMSQQVFAINQVEQQLESNKHLQNIENYFQKQQLNGAVSYIGKFAHYQGNKVLLGDSMQAEMKYDLPPNISRAQIIIKNSHGNEVHRDDLPTTPGANKFLWQTTDLDKGVYSFEIEAFDEEEKAQPVAKYGYGLINSVINENNTSTLEINNELVPLEAIQKYTDLLPDASL